MHIIQIENLGVQYDQVRALQDITFNIEQGEFLGIIGPNGGGKTSLIKSILGHISPSKGSITMDPGVIVGYVPQFSSFDASFPITVGEVVLSGHLPRKPKLFYRYPPHVHDHVDEVMEELGIESLYDRQIGQLSGGQARKVLIARALMNHPNVLILDEPTAGVDEASRQHIYDMLKTLNERMTIIIVSHNINQLMPYLDRVIYIEKRAHIHMDKYDQANEREEDGRCPINWYMQGEKIGGCDCCDVSGEVENAPNNKENEQVQV